MKISGFLRIAFLTLLLGVTGVSLAEEQTPQAKFNQALKLMEANKYVEALPLLDYLRANYPTASVYWNLGIVATETGDYSKALQAWLAYRKADPGRWQARAKLVQTYQALGDIEKRDSERAALFALWQANTVSDLSSQQMYCREQFRVDGHKVLALEFFKPFSPAMVVYSFVVVNSAGETEYRVSLGSDDVSNEIALELGDRTKDVRDYYLDLYRQNYHATYGMYQGQPSYEIAREGAVGAISGKSKPMSSSTR